MILLDRQVPHPRDQSCLKRDRQFRIFDEPLRLSQLTQQRPKRQRDAVTSTLQHPFIILLPTRHNLAVDALERDDRLQHHQNLLEATAAKRLFPAKIQWKIPTSGVCRGQPFRRYVAP